jgi:hypothetical protein
MSGLEVIGAISATIGIIDAVTKLYDGAQKDLQLTTTFRTVGQRLPVINNILQTCRNRLEPIKNSIPADVCESLENIIDGCQEKAGKLRQIFEKITPGDSDAWMIRYKKIFKRLGKGNKVEELMVSITEDVRIIVDHQAVTSGGAPDTTLIAEIEEVIMEMKSIESSVLEEQSAGMQFDSGGGAMTNNLNTGSGQMINNLGAITTQNINPGKT